MMLLKAKKEAFKVTHFYLQCFLKPRSGNPLKPDYWVTISSNVVGGRAHFSQQLSKLI